jgi:dolichol kinase
MSEISYKQELFRKMIHLSSLWMVCAIVFFRDNRLALGIFFAVCCILNVILERLVVLKVPVITPIYSFFFKDMLRSEAKNAKWVISGSPPVWAAAALATLLFPAEAGASGLAIMLIADTAAALIGRKLGKHKTYNNKSIEGIIAFNLFGIICMVIISGFFSESCTWIYYIWGVIGVFLSSMAELFEKQLHIDDNFSIVIINGLFLSIGLYLI